jgi:hypothetical protein
MLKRIIVFDVVRNERAFVSAWLPEQDFDELWEWVIKYFGEERYSRTIATKDDSFAITHLATLQTYDGKEKAEFFDSPYEALKWVNKHYNDLIAGGGLLYKSACITRKVYGLNISTKILSMERRI